MAQSGDWRQAQRTVWSIARTSGKRESVQDQQKSMRGHLARKQKSGEGAVGSDVSCK